MIRASSLLYAIYVCLVISIVSGVLIGIFTIHKQQSTRQAIKEQLIDRCDSCFEYALTQPQLFQNETTQHIDLFDDGLKCIFETKPWGVYTTILGRSYFKKDTISNQFLVGGKQNNDKLALYLCDLGEELKISGTTEIIGDVKLPRKGYKIVNLLGNQQQNTPKIKGEIKVSGAYLPKTNTLSLKLPKRTNELTLEALKHKKIRYNSFDKPTIVIRLARGEHIDRIHLKGNFIIEAIDTLRINNSSVLEDIIIRAPKVIIEEAFEGNMQIYATKEVEIGSKVTLNYPSAIIMNDTEGILEKKITIAKKASVFGGIVINGVHFEAKQNSHLTIEEEAIVMGDIYCNGILELKGNVIGTVYTYKLKVETQSALYENTVLNAMINSTDLPSEFIQLPLFVTTGIQQFGQIKKIQ